MIEIKLTPSNWILDFYTETQEELPEILHRRYGASVEYYENELDHGRPFVCTMSTTDESILRGETRIMCWIPKHRLHIDVIVHELEHIGWHFSANCGVELNFDSQEWAAIFKEYVFRRMRKHMEELG